MKGNIMSKGCLLVAFIASTFFATAQDTAMVDEVAEQPIDTVQRDYVLVDGVAAVVGDYIILKSDVDKAMLSLKSQGYSTKDVTDCSLLGKLMEDKLFMHHAVQDSIEVSETEIRRMVDARIENYFLPQVGGDMAKLLDIYGLETEGELREQLNDIVKEQTLTERMRTKITDDIEITPEEVRTFFYSIPEDERPVFGESVEISQIVIEPNVPEEEEQKVIEKLMKMKEDIEDNGVRFASKAMLYSEDPGSKSHGGLYTSITRNSQFVKEFKDQAFRLKEGEVSDPFKTMFGWHILTVDRIRGEQRDIRHILLMPDVPREAVAEAKREIDSIRQLLVDKKITFSEAAKAYSDEEETKYDGGRLINPQTQDFRFELSKMDPTMYSNISDLENGEISQPVYEQDDRTKTVSYKIYMVTNKVEDHIADYSKDYTQIQSLALQDKQLKAVKDWIAEKIVDTYISVSDANKNCDFANNWLKK